MRIFLRAMTCIACHGAGLLGPWQSLRGTMPWGSGIDRYAEPSNRNPNGAGAGLHQPMSSCALPTNAAYRSSL
jgi:hypothetical protein